MFYKYKNNYYLYKKAVLLKNPKTREWEEAVLYSPIIDSIISNIEYVREKKNFLKKFKRIEFNNFIN